MPERLSPAAILDHVVCGPTDTEIVAVLQEFMDEVRQPLIGRGASGLGPETPTPASAMPSQSM